MLQCDGSSACCVHVYVCTYVLWVEHEGAGALYVRPSTCGPHKHCALTNPNPNPLWAHLDLTWTCKLPAVQACSMVAGPWGDPGQWQGVGP